jgi:hypothetical protein
MTRSSTPAPARSRRSTSWTAIRRPITATAARCRKHGSSP